MKSLIFLIATSLSFSSFAQDRFISAGAGITELLLALKAQPQIVAADSTSRQVLKGTDIPLVGYHRQLSPEGLLALNPTEVIGSKDMGPESTLTVLKSSGVKITVLPEANTILELQDNIKTLATLTAQETNGDQLMALVQQQAATLEAHSIEKKPNVLFLMISESGRTLSAGKMTTVDTVIALSGAINPASEQNVEGYKPLSQEAIIAMAPDYLLIAERSMEKLGGIEGLLKAQPWLAITPALKKQQVIAIESSSIIGGLGLGSLRLATQLKAEYRS